MDLKQARHWLKSDFAIDKTVSDQTKKIKQPPLQKEVELDGVVIDLPKVNEEILKKNNFFQIMNARRSQRQYIDKALTIDELAFLLWATQGVKQHNHYATLRTVPSAGARHPFETYIFVQNIVGLGTGVYRYIAMSHQLIMLNDLENMKNEVIEGCLGQKFVGEAAVVFAYSCIPYRTEWRYTESSSKLILLDAGHFCQNLYLAAEAINCGTCAVGAYDQKKMDALLSLDGEDEFIIYLAPVGKIQ